MSLASGGRYSPSGGLTALTYGNGVTRSAVRPAGQNARGLYTSLSEDGPFRSRADPLNYSYSYDKLSRLTAIADVRWSGPEPGDDEYDPNLVSDSRTFGYDGAGRLIDARLSVRTDQGGWHYANYSYDAGGDMQEKVIGTKTVTMDYGSKHRLRKATVKVGAGAIAARRTATEFPVNGTYRTL